MGALLIYDSDSSHVGGSGFDKTYIFGEWYSMDVPLIGIPLTIGETYFFRLLWHRTTVLFSNWK